MHVALINKARADFVTLGKFNNVHQKKKSPSKSNLIMITKRVFFFADLAAEDQRAFSILFLRLDVLVRADAKCECSPPSAFSEGMHPCNCRGQRATTPRLPAGVKGPLPLREPMATPGTDRLGSTY